MVEIIQQSTTDCNSDFSHSSVVRNRPSPADLINRLPKTQYTILNLLLEYHDSCKEFSLGNKLLAKRLDLSEETVSRHVADLKRAKLIAFKDCGQNTDVLCITYEGVNWLVNKASTKSSTQIDVIPYIDLSKKKEDDYLKIFKEEVLCEQLEDENKNYSLDQRLDKFLVESGITYNEREALKSDVKRANIGPVRSEKIIRRVVAIRNKKPIQSIRSYFRQCIFNEEKEIRGLKRLFDQKGLDAVMYSTNY